MRVGSTGPGQPGGYLADMREFISSQQNGGMGKDKRSTVYGTVAGTAFVDRLDIESGDVAPWSELRIDSRHGSPFSTTITKPAIQKVTTHKKIKDFLFKPDTVEVDLASMTQNTWRDNKTNAPKIPKNPRASSMKMKISDRLWSIG